MIGIDVYPGNEVTGKCYTCLGIDVQALLPTPGRKSFRIDINLYDGVSFTREVIETVFSSLQPLLECFGKDVAV